MDTTITIPSGESDKILFSIRDDGRPFNPLERKETGLGLAIVKGMCENLKYSYIANLNVITAEISIRS